MNILPLRTTVPHHGMTPKPDRVGRAMDGPGQSGTKRTLYQLTELAACSQPYNILAVLMCVPHKLPTVTHDSPSKQPPAQVSVFILTPGSVAAIKASMTFWVGDRHTKPFFTRVLVPRELYLRPATGRRLIRMPGGTNAQLLKYEAGWSYRRHDMKPSLGSR